MSSASCAQVLKFAAATALVAPLALAGPARAADATPSPCSEDAMIVFDASGSMAGNVSQGIATIKPRIDEARHALATVLPRVTRLRRMALALTTNATSISNSSRRRTPPNASCGRLMA